jgi:hypothetical protein
MEDYQKAKGANKDFGMLMKKIEERPDQAGKNGPNSI